MEHEVGSVWVLIVEQQQVVMLVNHEVGEVEVVDDEVEVEVEVEVVDDEVVDIDHQ